MVAAQRHGTWSAVRLISKSTGGGDAGKVKCKAMAISRSTGREKDDGNYKRFFCKDQEDWGVMRGEDVRLDLNSPRIRVVTAYGQHTS